MADEPFKVGIECVSCSKLGQFCSKFWFPLFCRILMGKTLQSGGWTYNLLKIRQILVQNVNFGLFYHIYVADGPYNIGGRCETCSNLEQF